jgi:uncharacterized protein YjiS (DUF1127 family)
MAFLASPAIARPRANAPAGWLATLRAALHRRAIYRQTVRELGQLSVRELADLGLVPAMIPRAALEATAAR